VEKNGNQLEVRRNAAAGLFRSDRSKVRQILLILLANASMFTQGGTVIFGATVSDGRVGLSVTDTGIGMTPEQMGRLFQAFAQADSSITGRYGGTGLGLAISRRFARLLGGEIHVTSAKGHGSTFTLELPRDAAAAGSST
jgi:signal transduction histidine kinase